MNQSIPPKKLYQRRIEGLIWADWLDKAPFDVPRGQTAAQKKGYRYEDWVGRRLRRMGLEPSSGRWIKYEDFGGQGNAELDHLVELGELALLLECKLTQSSYAESQLLDFYVPLVSWLTDKVVVPVQVCKNLKWEENLVSELPKEPPKTGVWTWHLSV